MLHLLKIKDSFAHKNREYNFEAGLTAISGLNGTGKTELVDIVQWLLWGSKALRGDATDYAHYHAEMDFSVKGTRYAIRRNKGGAVLLKMHQSEYIDVARGTKPVNAAIQRIFGYSYEVFKMANISRQGEAQKLCDMLPTERKRMVDETIGLAKLDEISKWAKAEMSTARARYDTITKYLVEPAACMVDSTPDKSLSVLQDVQARLREHQQVWLTASREASTPVVTVDEHPQLAFLETFQEDQRVRVDRQAKVVALTNTLNSFPKKPTVVELHPEDANEAALRAETKQKNDLLREMISKAEEFKLIPPVLMTQEEIDAELKAHEDYNHWLEREQAVKAQKDHQITCPECKHTWAEGWTGYVPYADLPEVVSKPTKTKAQLTAAAVVLGQQERRKGLEATILQLDADIQKLIDHSLVLGHIVTQRDKHRKYLSDLALQEQREKIETQLAELTAHIPEDRTAIIAAIQENIRKLNLMRDAEETVFLAKKVLADHPEEGYSQRLKELDGLIVAKIQYEADKARYDKQKADYSVMKTESETVAVSVEQYAGVVSAITAMRTRVKNHLIPSLNKVASTLLASMSNRWLNHVAISEDFDIMVDGKKVKSLSGAGKDLTNLAIRVALGLVLTNNVFPVLMLDEVDQGVDVAKAPALAEALKRLTTSIAQIIQISHKAGLVADHRIEL